MAVFNTHLKNSRPTMRLKTRIFQLLLAVLIFQLYCPAGQLMAQDKKKTTVTKITQLTEWSVGIKCSPALSYRWLHDNPRFESFAVTHFTDHQFITYRNKYERPRIVTLWGIYFEKYISERLTLHFGSNGYGIGENIYTTQITEQPFKNIFPSTDDTLVNKYMIHEFPLMLKVKIAPNLRYNLKNKGISLLNYNRLLYGIIGVAAGGVIYNGSYYSDYMESEEGNIIFFTKASDK
jgi:hypothetical protein